ncbi:molybdate transport system substrate-binding protein [Variovorax sp. GrIS 2.14]
MHRRKACISALAGALALATRAANAQVAARPLPLNDAMTTTIRGISSMASRALLADLAEAFSKRSGVPVSFVSVGGVDTARRIDEGERFDLAVLDSKAIDKLIANGKLDGSGKADLFRSDVGVAVRVGAGQPNIATAEALRSAVLGADRIGYSTGPSGVELMALFERWGIAAEVKGRLVQASPGVPVGTLLVSGAATLGFQQMSEMIGIQGIQLIGPMPPEARITTVFSAAPLAGGQQPAAVGDLIRFLASADATDAKRRHGMAAV